VIDAFIASKETDQVVEIALSAKRRKELRLQHPDIILAPLRPISDRYLPEQGIC